jgi:ATP phosphoribosyltransferase regulatory subunit
LCYLGPILHTLPSGFAGSRNPFQVGAELYGHKGVESDAEILCLMLETLRAVGTAPIVVDLGHMAVFRGLATAASLDSERASRLFDLLQKKARPELIDCMADWQINSTLAEQVLALTELNGGEEVLAQARQVFGTGVVKDGVTEALQELEAISILVKQRVPTVSLHFDLAEIGGYHYYTGLAFAAYVPGQGQAVAKGGRYDDIGRVFGRARPATGFSTDLKRLVALAPREESSPSGIYAPWVDDADLLTRIAELRRSGMRVITGLPGQPGDARELQCDRRLERRDGRWDVVDL